MRIGYIANSVISRLEQKICGGGMALLLSLVGLLLIVAAKRLVWEVDHGKALWNGLLEVPVDINLVGFLLGLATIGQLASPSEHAPVLIALSFLLILSGVSLWKYSCSLISDRDGEPYFSNTRAIIACTLINIIVAILSIVLPIVVLGARF
jgi:hypothetical protein